MIVPTDEDIDSVISILGLDTRDRNVVSSALQAKNNNIEQVVNEYFDNPSKFNQQYAWNEDMFSAERDGSTDHQVPSFSIHPPDSSQVIQGVEPSYYGAGAPSRPPSRTNNRSPLSKLVAYTADHSTGATLPTSSEQEDADLQRAIAESVATSGMQSPQPLPQESGITQAMGQADTSLPYFGPATRPGYEQDQWAMVTLNRETPEPGPSRRKRGPGVPAFLRCRRDNSWERHRLGAILTIFHSIPAARNVLLRSGEPAQSYGHNSEWWKGGRILRPAAQGAQNVAAWTWEDEASVGWSEELHRLMAFLDATERSYGTADLLSETSPDGSMSSGDCEKDFFEHIRNEPGNLEKMSPLMATAEVVKVVGDEPGPVNEWGLLEPSFPKEQLMTAENLYNIWDMIFFMDVGLSADLDSARMAMITHPAEVMTIRFGGDDTFPRPITIPQTFYIDRYLASNREEMSRLQRDMSILAQGVVQAQKAEDSLTTFVVPTSGAKADRVTLCKRAIAKYKDYIWKLKASARWRKHEEARKAGDDSPYFPMNRDEDIEYDVEFTPEESKMKRAFEAEIKFYQRKLLDIERKLQRINDRKKACEEVFRELGAVLTAPSEDPKYNPTHAYTLRGVASSPDTFFVCLRAEPDLMELDGPEGASATAEQWWKLGYVADDEQPAKAEMTTYEKAMEEACGVGSKPILIYASNKALEEDRDPLSDALQTFVRFDNRLFRQELKEESPQERKRGAFGSPSSPSKRRNRSSSVDSMATNLGSTGGDLDDDMRDAPFEFDDPFPGGGGSEGTELRELVDTSVPAETPTTKPQAEYPNPSQSDGRELESPTSHSDSAGPADASLDEVSVGAGAERPPPELPPRTNIPAEAAEQHQEQQQQPEQQQQQPRSPEMQERKGASFFVPPSNSSKAASMFMELDDHHDDR